MKSVYCLVLIAVLHASCTSPPSGNAVQTAIAQTQIAQPTSTPPPTLTPTESKPSISEIFKEQLTRFLEESTKLNAMSEQGVNYNDFKQQLANVKGAYDLANATWPSDFAPGVHQSILKTFDGWDLALYVWGLKINDSDNPVEPDINGYVEITNYGGDNLVYDVHDQNYIVEDYRGKKFLPFDDNIGVLLSLASDQIKSVQKQILAELP
jgi:hypothetical protein